MKKIVLSILLIAFTIVINAQAFKPIKSMYKKGWIDFNKNGKKDIYEDPTQSLDKRLDDIIAQMNLEEKTAQMATLYGYKRVLKDSLPTLDWKNEYGKMVLEILMKC